MPLQGNYYEILGVSRNASTAEIKKRYRELARRYHPDVAKDKAASARDFVRITEAYKTLVDPEKRSTYDLTLPKPAQAAPSAGTSSRQARQTTYSRQAPPGAASQRTGMRPEVQKLIRDAEFAFIRRRLNEAKNLCMQAISIDQKCARAHAILGDIYRARKMHNHAINEYNYAVQFNPADVESQKKLTKLLSKTSPVRFSWEEPDGSLTKEAIIMNIVGWSIAVFILFLVNIYPGKPIPWLSQYYLSAISTWSWNLVGIVFGDGVLVGLLLSINKLLEHPDDELVFERGKGGWIIVPTGLILTIFGPIFFLGAAALYLAFGFIQSSLSSSVLRVFLATGVIVLMSALMYPLGKLSVLLFGGNVAFCGIVLGWYLGVMLRSDDTLLTD